jgi:hypothetical protein
MSRWMMSLLLAALGTAGCATARHATPESSSKPYGAAVTYTMSAAALAELAQTGQDWKVSFSVETGSSNQSRSCTVAPAAPVVPPSLAQRLVLAR